MKWIGKHIWDFVSLFRNKVGVNTESQDPVRQLHVKDTTDPPLRLEGIQSKETAVEPVVVDTGNGDVYYHPSSYWNLVDPDDNTVRVSWGDYVKFLEGTVDATAGIEISITDSSHGTLGDPYDVTFSHANTSSQASVDVSGANIIQEITLDTYGHVTDINTAAIDVEQTMGEGFVLEDHSGTEVTITMGKEVKFIAGTGMTIGWTDTDNGTDADPYDMTFSSRAAGTDVTSVGETGGTKFLREDGDGTCSWQTPSYVANTDTTYSISCVDGDNSDEEKIRLTAGGSGSGTDDVVLEAGTGLSIARSSDKITFSVSVDADTSTKGFVELATDSEAITGTDADRAVTASGVKAHVESRKVHELAAPTATLSMNSQNIDGLAAPAADDHAATKAYVDAKVLAYYRFMGYTTGDGTNYEVGPQLTDAQAPWEHNTTTSSDGLTITAASGTNVSDIIRFGGHVMVRGGTLKLWKGWATNNNNSDLTIGIFKWTPADNDNTTITPVLLDAVTIAGKGNDKVRSFSETTFTVASVSAGDIIFTQMKTEGSGNVAYFQSGLEILYA